MSEREDNLRPEPGDHRRRTPADGLRQAPDDSLHAWFDRDVPPERAEEWSARIESDPELRGRRDALRRMEDWLRETRQAAPAGLSARIERALEAEPAGGSPAAAAVAAGALRPGRLGARRWLQWAWVPVAAAALLVLLFHERPAPTAASEGLVGRDFVCVAGGARQVCLVGDFNQWTVCRTPLSPEGDGTWKIHLDLPHGRHEYMFVIDGRWETDPSVPQTVDDGFGSKNTLLLL